MTKILVVCGPTASGKTKLGIFLAKMLNGEVVSADSRQVYRGLDIGTGKDLPLNSKLKIQNSKSHYGYYTINGIKVWGYDLAGAKDAYSVSQYIEIANLIISDIWKRGKLPILVGGTGYYIKGVIDGIPTASIPRNISLREEHKKKSRKELQVLLENLDTIKFNLLNNSDKNNPRRLVRAIEIAKANSKLKNQKSKKIKTNVIYDDLLMIGLTTQKNILYRNIETRVEERLKSGLIVEIRGLLNNGVSWENQSMQSLGYKQFREFFKGSKTLDTVVKDWINDEKHYAKRQLTWFRKDKRINWFDINNEDWVKSVEKLAIQWHNGTK